jgi:hypothetical protein
MKNNTPTPVSGITLTDTEAMNLIAREMSAQEWGADTLDVIAAYVRGTGRTIADSDSANVAPDDSLWDVNPHWALWQAENSESENARRWESWIDKVEALLGHSADGNNSDAAKAAGTADGYSMDEFYDMWKAGQAPRQAVDSVGEHKAPRS